MDDTSDNEKSTNEGYTIGSTSSADPPDGNITAGIPRHWFIVSSSTLISVNIRMDTVVASYNGMQINFFLL